MVTPYSEGQEADLGWIVLWGSFTGQVGQMMATCLLFKGKLTYKVMLIWGWSGRG